MVSETFAQSATTADLFADKSVISRHLKGIFYWRVITREKVKMQLFNSKAREKSYGTSNITTRRDASVGYRVNSTRATRFRHATTVLREHRPGYTPIASASNNAAELVAALTLVQLAQATP